VLGAPYVIKLAMKAFPFQSIEKAFERALFAVPLPIINAEVISAILYLPIAV
jgi:hypothetical protein